MASRCSRGRPLGIFAVLERSAHTPRALPSRRGSRQGRSSAGGAGMRASRLRSSSRRPKSDPARPSCIDFEAI